jgi:putative MATE family efflux protein
MHLTQDPIGTLIRQLAIPASVGFFFNTMYNVVDTWYAGRLSTDALGALSISFPVFFLLIAISGGLSQGATALMANALGAQKPAEASQLAVQAGLLGACLGVLLTAVGLLLSPTLFGILGASGPYLQIALDYMNTIWMGTLFFIGQSMVNAALQAQGDTATYRNQLIAGFFMNLLLNPWFMYGGLGVPAMGIGGIALATVLIQLIGLIYMISKLMKTALAWPIHLEAWRPKWGTWCALMAQGLPASMSMMTVAAGIFIITWFVSFFSQEGVAAYGIATRIEQILLLPTIGLNVAVLTLVGQNHGAGRWDRVREIRQTSLKIGLAMMLAGGGLLYLMAEPAMGWFTPDTEVRTLGSDYLRIASITLCAYVILFQTVFMLQGIKRPMMSLWIGLYRQILAPMLVFYGLAFGLDWKLDGIWWGIFGVTWSAALFSFFYGNGVIKQLASSSEPH